MSTPESDLSWHARYDYAVNSLSLFDNDQDPGQPVNIRRIFVEQATDVAKVEERETDIGGGLIHTSLEWEEPINDERVPGLESLIRWLREQPGERGDKGEKGEQGDPGEPGEQGEHGAAGLQGLRASRASPASSARPAP